MPMLCSSMPIVIKGHGTVVQASFHLTMDYRQQNLNRISEWLHFCVWGLNQEMCSVCLCETIHSSSIIWKKWINEWTNEWMNKRTNEQMNKWMNKQMNEQINWLIVTDLEIWESWVLCTIAILHSIYCTFYLMYCVFSVPSVWSLPDAFSCDHQQNTYLFHMHGLIYGPFIS